MNGEKIEMESVWAVVPAFNESRNLPQIVKKIKKYVQNVVVVDDGSNDSTYDAASGTGAVVLRHMINLGKGAALKTGCDYAVENGAEFMVVLDADAQHDSDEIPSFLEKLKEYDIVFGYRKLGGDMPFVKRFGNWFISQAIKILYNIRLFDSQSGYRAFSMEAYQKIRWSVSDYSMESEMIAKAGRHRLKYAQIPIKTIYSNASRGTTIIDGVKIVLNMVWWRLFNNRE